MEGYIVLQCVYNYLVNGGGHCLTMDVTLVCTVWSLVLGRAEDGPLCPTWCSTALQGMGVVHLAVGWTWPCVGMGGCLFLDIGLQCGWVVAALDITSWFGGPQNWGPPGWTSLGAIVSNQ